MLDVEFGMQRIAVAASLLAIFSAAAHAEIKTSFVDYTEGGVTLQGFLAYDDAKVGSRPAVMIVHDWDGLGTYEQDRAKQLAAEGYVAFAADIYGKGVRPNNPQDNAKEATKYRSDIPLFRRRLNAGFETMLKQANVNPAKTAAIGYCFGGGGVLELARSGANVQAVVSFHGGIGTTTPEDAKNIRGKVLVIGAAQDPAVPREAITGFLNEMQGAKIDYQMVLYNLNVHAFTVPGAQYDATADRRSFAQMKTFFGEVFGS